ncbi:hypothetical protein HDU87_008448 [Geranomyces variabilis]|uniref:Uncharacterized protein n=1 Tax=Geranomyces variabilis TaxID=109894 RepID=A0AAD5TD62_9FUNG|nr:hypothetical protein HDU87_008448 [Geranomyces variabilis]
MDLATEQLIISLELQDLAELSIFRKGKQRCREEDAIDPFEEYRSELLATRDSLCLAASLQTAILTDATAIAELSSQNVQAEEDRRLALDLSAREAAGRAGAANAAETARAAHNEMMSRARPFKNPKAKRNIEQ